MDSVVASWTVETERLETHVLESGDEDGEPVVFLHGNASSARFYAELLADLPDDYRAVAPALREFGAWERRPIDPTRGLRDFADDVHALATGLGFDAPAVVGWSTGGGAVLQYAIDRPDAVDSLTLIDPAPPYGYGGTRRDGTPCQPDYAGTGAGLVDEDFVERIERGDRTDEADASPRNVLRSAYVAPGTELESYREDAYVDAVLDTKTGDEHYPGDALPSNNWPGVAPGMSGVNNALSPKYYDLTDVVDVPVDAETAPPILWLRGSEDPIVADGSPFEAGYLGKIGELPGWPGEDEYPPQPMVAQTHDVLKEYVHAGGEYKEVVVEDAGHSPHVEQPGEVLSALADHLG